MFASRHRRILRALSARDMLTSAAALAVSLAGGGAAHAQAFLGTPTVVSGSVTIDRNTPNLDVVTVGSNQSIVDWTPTDTATGGGLNNPINFLPPGAQVIYGNNSAVTDYTILNRIVPVDPARPIAFNGTVTSQLTDALGATATGGSVWFYSPGGIIVGDGAVFDIGSLLLTTLDPAVDGGGNFLTGGAFSLQQATPGSIVNVLSNAAINATAEGSYVALVAPIVYQRGTVTVNGSAAYVAAEAADITIDNGLFDINVTVGSSDNGFPLQHLGTTTGPASTGAGDNHRIYMVTIPKNDAVTMVFGNTSQLGFDIAGAADVVNNVVVLSAGRNVSDTTFAPTPVNGTDANIAMDGGAFTSYLTARATTNLLAASNTGTTQFASSVRFQAGGSAQLAARENGVAMNIGGDVTIVGDAVDGIAAGANATAGEALLYADNGGILNVAGNATILANATGGGNTVGTTGSGIAGRTLINADSGIVTINGDVTMNADGTAGTALGTGVEAGDGTGGVTEMTVDNGGSITVLGSVSMTARGYGGENSGGGDGISGAGTGGLINLVAVNGTIGIQGDVTADTLGSGGFTVNGLGGGVGQGGQTVVGAGAGSLTIESDAVVLAQGSGGSVSFSGNGGAATGGTARITVYQAGGNVEIGGSSQVSATANGGFASSGGTGVGGAATGGTAAISAGDGSAAGATITLGSDILVEANGFGGSSASGGAGTGGRATIVAQGGSIYADPANSNVNVQAYSLGGDAFGPAGTGGNGTGGIAEIVALNFTAPGSITLGTVDADASGRGGQGGFGLSDGSNGGRGGDGTGGQVLLLGSAGNGVLSLGAVDAEANGAGGNGGRGGDDLMGTGPGGAGGRGGDGFGGNVQIGTQSGTATPDNSGSATFVEIIATTDGEGGTAGDGGTGLTQGANGNGGDGIGGVGGGTVLLVRGSPVTVGTVLLSSNGIGGAGGIDIAGGNGGVGESGNVAIVVSERFQTGEPGLLEAGDIIGQVVATGGSGVVPGATRYGSADIQVRNGSATVGSIDMQVSGDTPGAQAQAAPSSILVVNGSVNVSDALSMQTPGDIALVADGGTIEAGSFTALAAGSIVDSIDGTAPAAPGTVRATSIDIQVGANMISGASLESLASLNLIAPGSIAFGGLASDGPIYATAGGNVTVGDVNAGDLVELTAQGGDLVVGDITALSDVELVADGSVDAGAIVSGDSVTAISGTTTTIGSISAGLVNPSSDPAARYRVGVDAGTSATIGDIAAASDIGLLARAGALNAGTVTTPGSLVAFASNGVTLAGATTGTGPNHTVYIADASMAALLGPDFDPEPLFNADPVASAGPITISGPVTTGLFVAAGQSFTAQGAIDAQIELGVLATGLASFNAAMTAPVMTISSGDIAIGTNGRLGSSATTDLTLISTGAVTTIGGSQPVTGYVLDGAEAQRLSAGDIEIIGGAQVELRDLNLAGANGPNANVTDSGGGFVVSAGNAISVTGAVRFTGMTSGNSLLLSSPGQVAVVTDTGSIGLFGTGTALAGVLGIESANIRVASSNLLSQLSGNPNFSGRDQALAQVAGTPRPEGYLQAGGMEFVVGQQLLIQNSNNSGSFGGFTAGAGGLQVLALGSGTPVDLIIYGRLADASGFVTNNDVRDAISLSSQGSGFSSVSSVNGCLLSAATCDDVPPPQSGDDGIVGSIATDVLAIVNNETEPAAILTGDELGQAGASRSPIMPPVSLISTGAMTSDDVIEEPVTSGGNPSLMSVQAPGAIANSGGRE